VATVTRVDAEGVDAGPQGASGGRRPSAPRRSRAIYPLGVAGLAALYYAAARLGFAVGFAGPVAAIVWLPVGVGISGLYLAGVRYLPGVLLGEVLTNHYAGLPLGSAVGQTCGNMLEVIVGALLLRRLAVSRTPLGSVEGLGRMIAAIVVATFISAAIGTFSLRAGNVVAASDVTSVFRTWWLGDACGALVVVPLAIAWYRPAPEEWSRGRMLEAALSLTALVALGELALRSHRPLTYLALPPLVWAALRFGRRGATLAIAITVGLAVWNTAHYFGPFSFDSISRSELSTQLFIAVAALSTLALAALGAERKTFAAGLRTSRARLVASADTERRRLERNLHDGAQQRLTALLYRLSRSRELAAADPALGATLLEEAEEELLVAIDELRELARGIRPVELAGGGLAGAITNLAASSAVPVTLVQLPPTRLDSTVEATAFYVVAESITNTHRYAEAASIRVRAAVTRGLLVVDVVDDGIGGVVERPGSGLHGLRDRVEAIGGSFRVTSQPGRGTHVSAAIPMGEARWFSRSG
jgi:signal transduction histidine kinase